MISRSSLRRTAAHPFSRRTDSSCRTDSSTTGSGNSGFTLIELLIVVIILGILVAVAIPIFIRQTNLAKETSAESMLRSLGTGAYAGMVESRAASDFTEQIDDVTGNAVKPRYPKTSDTASSKNDKDVVAKVDVDIEERKNPKPPSQWLAAVAPRPGRCTIVNVTATTGMVASRTVDSVNGQCRADLSSSIPLVASDFNAKITHPAGGTPVGNPVWNNGVLSIGWGMLLNNPSASSLNNGSVSANITLASAGNATGLAFRGSQSNGNFSGYVYQIDRGLNQMVLWRWENGVQKAIVSQIGFPAGTNINGANTLQVNLTGNSYSTTLNGQPIGSGTLPINPATGQPYSSGTDYGVRNSTGNASTVSDLKLTPAG